MNSAPFIRKQNDQGTILQQPAKAHAQGFKAGQQRRSLAGNPYGRDTAEAWAWVSGYIEGKAQQKLRVVVIVIDSKLR